MSADNDKVTTPIEILEVALKKEKDARLFYESILSRTRVGIVRETLEKLRDEEYKHIHMIEKLIAKIRLG